MTSGELLVKLMSAKDVREFEEAIERFEAAHGSEARWLPVGRENNRGAIEAASDPGRSLVERLTNGIDAVLELEHGLHKGVPDCKSPKDAAGAWLGVPTGGLSEMSAAERRALAQRVSVTLNPGEGKDSRIVEIRDRGTGLSAAQMPTTILSLNETNKAQKLYLAGAYGQGGSSTFAVSKATLIASRTAADQAVGFTVVRFRETPPTEFKPGQYVYLTIGGKLPTVDRSLTDFPAGTLVRHVGYDLTSYGSPLGPKSVYGLLNQILFDPVMPVWLDAHATHNYRRVIKGSRNALNGAVDEGDAAAESKLSHSVPLFRVDLGAFGRVGLEYWVLTEPTNENKRPTAAYVNDNKPVVLTLLGQNQGELPISLIRKDADLPYLALRLIVHVDCNALTPGAKRSLFVSNREDARRGAVLDLIKQEVVKALRSDDRLTELNNEARAHTLRERDQAAEQQMRSEVARLLRVQGLTLAEPIGGEVGGGATPGERPTHPRGPRPAPQPIEPREPPTFIRIKWEEDKPVSLYPEQRRYLRIETDANSTYHNPNDPAASRINIILTERTTAAQTENAKVVQQRMEFLNQGLQSAKHQLPVIARGSTPLQAGRMRFILEGAATAEPDLMGKIRVELSVPGRPTLADERDYKIVAKPPARPSSRAVSLPPFKVEPVEGPTDARWNTLGWGESDGVASSADMDAGMLVIYYNTQFPRFRDQRATFERRDAALAKSFTSRYEIWLAVHSLIFHQDKLAAEQAAVAGVDDEERLLEREREERIRIAKLAVMFAVREVDLPTAAPESE